MVKEKSKTAARAEKARQRQQQKFTPTPTHKLHKFFASKKVQQSSRSADPNSLNWAPTSSATTPRSIEINSQKQDSTVEDSTARNLSKTADFGQVQQSEDDDLSEPSVSSSPNEDAFCTDDFLKEDEIKEILGSELHKSASLSNDNSSHTNNGRESPSNTGDNQSDTPMDETRTTPNAAHDKAVAGSKQSEESVTQESMEKNSEKNQLDTLQAASSFSPNTTTTTINSGGNNRLIQKTPGSGNVSKIHKNNRATAFYFNRVLGQSNSPAPLATTTQNDNENPTTTTTNTHTTNSVSATTTDILAPTNNAVPPSISLFPTDKPDNRKNNPTTSITSNLNQSETNKNTSSSLPMNFTTNTPGHASSEATTSFRESFNSIQTNDMESQDSSSHNNSNGDRPSESPFEPANSSFNSNNPPIQTNNQGQSGNHSQNENPQNSNDQQKTAFILMGLPLSNKKKKRNRHKKQQANTDETSQAMSTSSHDTTQNEEINSPQSKRLNKQASPQHQGRAAAEAAATLVSNSTTKARSGSQT
jgi:hypothetical protein